MTDNDTGAARQLDALQAAHGSGIAVGSVYVYTNEIPEGCAGHHYRVHRFVLDVPTYQPKLLVEALDGKDVGLWFVCSIANFRARYVIAKDAAWPTTT